jgi:transcriptional regulator with XRE-family HTH domain
MPEIDATTAEQWAEFIDQWLTRRAITNSALADLVGVNRATVGNWRRAEVATPDHASVRAVANALGVDVKDAYLAAGILQADDLHVHTVEKSLSDFDSDDLVREVRLRMGPGRRAADEAQGNRAVRAAGNAASDLRKPARKRNPRRVVGD